MNGPIGCAYPSYSISMWSLRVQNHGQHPFTNGTNSTYNYIGNQPFTPIAYILALHHHTYIIIFPLVYTVFVGIYTKGPDLFLELLSFPFVFFGSAVPSVSLAICKILELVAAISTVLATFWSLNLCFHSICNILVLKLFMLYDVGWCFATRGPLGFV